MSAYLLLLAGVAAPPPSGILTEAGDYLTTEAGAPLQFDVGITRTYAGTGGLHLQGAASTVRVPIKVYAATGATRWLGTAASAFVPTAGGAVHTYAGSGGFAHAGVAVTSQGPAGVIKTAPLPSGGFQWRGAGTTWKQVKGLFLFYPTGRYTWLGAATTERDKSAWRFVVTWDVAAVATFRRLHLSWDVVATRLVQRMVLVWSVQPLLPGLTVAWDLIAAELPDAVLAATQILAPSITRETGEPIPVLGYTVDADLGLPADQYSLRVAGTQEVVGATITDRVNIAAGLRVGDTDHQVPLITDGGVDDYSLAEDPFGWTGSIKGRNNMARCLDQQVAIRFAIPNPEEPLEQSEAMETLPGAWWASDVARIVAGRVGLGLAWRCRDYPLQEEYQAVGRVLDIIEDLVAPWSQFEPLKVDVYARGHLIVAQARVRDPVADPVNVFPVRGGRVEALALTLQPLPALTDVTVQGMRAAPSVVIPVGTIAPFDAAVAAGVDPSVALTGSPSDLGTGGNVAAEDPDALPPVDDISGGVGGTPAGEGGATGRGTLYGEGDVTTGDTVFPDGTVMPAGLPINAVVVKAQAKGVQVIALEAPDGATRYAGTMQSTATSTPVTQEPVEPYLAQTTSTSQSNTPTDAGKKAGAVRGPVIGYTVEQTTYRMPDQLVLSVVKSTYSGLYGQGDVKYVSKETQTKMWEASQYGPGGALNQPLQLGERTTKEGYVPSSATDAAGNKSPLDWGVIEMEETSYAYDAQRLLKDEIHVSKKIKERSASEARAAAGGAGAEPAEYDYTAVIKHYRTEGRLWVKIETDHMAWEKETYQWVVVQRDSQVQAGHRAGGTLSADVAENQRPAQDEGANAESYMIANRYLALPGDPDAETETGGARAQKKAPKDGKGRVVNGRIQASKLIRARVPGTKQRSVRYQNAHLRMEDCEYLIAQAETCSGPSYGEGGEVLPGLWEHDLSVTLRGVPWLLPGQVIQFTDWEDSTGAIRALPAALVYHVTHTYAESRTEAQHQAVVRAVFWAPTPADLAAAGVPPARRPWRAVLPRLAGRRRPHALTTGRSY